MTLSKMSDRCEGCQNKDDCENKRMVLLAEGARELPLSIQHSLKMGNALVEGFLIGMDLSSKPDVAININHEKIFDGGGAVFLPPYSPTEVSMYKQALNAIYGNPANLKEIDNGKK